ncbi:DNRLRE domain-containing protein [Nocardioides sp. NPDC127503]|uniref:DNRLRE domain-containing protein n=1 Tax=Nocardioides sp. NPDC127503 TaxID=3154516 RepID=UPI0033334345
MTLIALISGLSVAVVVAGLWMPTTPAAAASVQAAEDSVLGTGDLDDRPGRPDAVSAAVSARASGMAVEDLSQRSESERVFANPDGSWTSETASEPTQVQDGAPGSDGTAQWNLVDPTLVEIPGTAGGWRPAHAAVKQSFTPGGTDWFASLTQEGHELRFGLDGDLADGGADAGTGDAEPVQFGTPVVSENTAVYKNVASDEAWSADLVVRASATGFEHWWVLNPVQSTPPESTSSSTREAEDEGSTLATATITSLDLALTVTDVTAQKSSKVDPVKVVTTDSGGIKLLTDKGTSVLQAPAPLYWDATTAGPDEFDPAAKALKTRGTRPPKRTTRVGEPADEGHVHKAKASARNVSKNGKATGVSVIRLGISAEVLTSAAAAGPVTVDPSFTVAPNADTWIQAPDYTTSQASSEELRVGTNDSGGHRARSFLKFDGGNSAWAGKHITSASLKLRNFYSGSCTGSAIRVSRLTSNWDLSGLTWANQPGGASTTYADLSTAHGFNSSCPAADATWNLTSMVQAWANGTANYGIRLVALNESVNSSWRRYRSGNYPTESLGPTLSVTYNSYPGTAGTPVASPGTAPYVTSLTPKVCFTVSDPDPGAKLRGSVEVYAGSTASGTALWSWTAAEANAVTAGTNVCPTIPTGKLTNGSTYTVRARASDGISWSKNYSASTTFTVDTTPPTVSISGTGFRDGEWTNEMPPFNIFYFHGAADTKSFSVVKDSGAPTTVTADASGTGKITWLPTNGAHTLKVTPTDKAGNVGTTATFSFGVGAASMQSPNRDDRSTGMFAISAAGQPSATGAELDWRYAGESTWNDAKGVTTTNGSVWSGTVSETSGTSTTPNLVWDATTQPAPTTDDPNAVLKAPARIELRTCFTYSGPSTVCSPARPVRLVPSAFGENFPTTDVGPASVALVTGEATITEPDAVDTAAGVGRTYATLDGSTLTNGSAGAFGPGWSTTLMAAGATDAKIVDHRSLDRTIVLVTAGSSSQMFTPVDPEADVTAPTGPLEFKPAGVDDGSRLVLDQTTDPDTLTLTRRQGPVTNWKRDATDGAWVLVKSDSGYDDDTDPEAQFSFDPTGGVDYPTWIAQTSPGAAATCTVQTQERGCRGLKFTYAGTGDAKRVSKIDRLTVNPDGTIATETVATYTYTNGLLTKVCGTDPDASGVLPSLCSSYDYDTTTVASRTLLAKVVPPGQKPWEFRYDSTGRLATVTRAQDENTTSGGTATWSIAYDLAPGHAGLPDMTPSTIARWGQNVTPVKVFAVFDPTKVPADRKNPTATEIEHADLWYTDAPGTTTNTAVHANIDGDPEWLIETTWYDEHGNTIRSLDGPGHHAALAASTVPEEQQVAAFDASTITEYNTQGTRVEAEYSPVQTATLEDGTTGTYRPATRNDYDDEEPTLGGGSKPAYPEGETSFDMIVQTHQFATSPDMTEVFDEQITRTEYAPLVSGDANGWKTSTPTKSLVKLADGNWRETAIDRYNTDGRQIETRQPGGAISASGAGSDANATVFSYYSKNNGDPDCDITGHANRAEWNGLVCKTGPAVQPAGQPIPVKRHADYNADLKPTTIVESSAAVTRTTTIGYDKLGRPTSTLVQVTGAGATNETIRTTVTYDPSTGMPASTSEGTNKVSATVDTWGRTWTSTDASGLEAITTYTSDGAVATFNDGRSLYKYAYDQATGEHRGVLTSVDLDLPSGTDDTLTIKRDARGQVAEVAYPNGMSAINGYTEAGAQTSLSYTTLVDGVRTELLGFAAKADIGGRILGYSSTASTQNYAYDSIGRLTRAEDTREGACTTRVYEFSKASERTSLTTYDPAAGDPTTGEGAGACQATTAATVKSSTYDSANRITNDGYSYDPLGRTLTVPAVDTSSGAGSGVLQLAYHANDMVKSMTQQLQTTAAGGTVITEAHGREYTLDPGGRIMTISSTLDGTERSRTRYEYAGATDSPSYVTTSNNAGQSWVSQRNVGIDALGLIASVSDGETAWQISNLHGDVVATILGSASGGISNYTETDEYGVVIGDGQDERRYGYVGIHQRSAGTDTLGGLILMGRRLYSPRSGLFNSIDPVLGGNANRYTYPVSPITDLDISGESGWGTGTRYFSWGKVRVEVYRLTAYVKVVVNKRGLEKFMWHAGGIAMIAGGIAYFAPWPFAKAVAGTVAAVAGLLGGGAYLLHTFKLGAVYKSLHYKYAPVVLWHFSYASRRAYYVGM